jgi:DNA gyrase subunit A
VDDPRLRLRSLQERARLLSAIIAGIDRFDEVAAAIAGSESRDEMRAALMELLGVDEFQAMAVADMQVRLLSRERRAALAAEHAEVLDGIAALT